MVRGGRVFARGRWVLLAWYPQRRLRSGNVWLPNWTARGRHLQGPWTRRHLGIGLGPLYLGLGRGRPVV